MSLCIVRYVEVNIFTFPTHTLQVELICWLTLLNVLHFCVHKQADKERNKRSKDHTPLALEVANLSHKLPFQFRIYLARKAIN